MAPRRLRYLSYLLASGVMLMAQTTGGVQGRVLDPNGHPVAGAKVTLAGAGLQGGRSTTSDETGAFRFGLVPPGLCTITATKEGLNAAKAQAQVGLDRTATVDLAMNAVASAIVEVSGISTAMDLTATTVGANYTSETITKLPLSRDFSDVALLAPGVTNDNSGFKVYGASGAENNYVVDGINTTNVEFGTQGKKIPLEFIQEFQVKTGGYEAEFGRASGGIINVITKSGGNDFSGDIFAYSEGSIFKTGNKHQNDSNLSKPLPTEDKKLDFGFDAGGAIIKDKLWYFVAYDRAKENKTFKVGLGQAIEAPQDSTRDLFAAKLTWRISGEQTLIASILGDPEKITGAAKSPQGSIGTWEGEKKVGGTDYSLRYEVNGTRWFGQLQASRHNESNSTLAGVGANQIHVIDQTAGGLESGGFGRWDEKDFTRDNVAGSITGFLGSHELKAGFDLQTDKADIRRGYTGGQEVTILPGGVYSHYYWTTGDATITPFNAPSVVFTSKPKHESQAYFAQDKWSLTPKLIFNLGVRLDQTDIKDQFGAKVISLKDQWSPRLGLNWDWKGQGQDKVYMSLSRYYEQVPLDLVIRSFSVERNPTTVNFDPVSLVPDPLAGTSSIVGSYVEPVDPDLKGQYGDEFVLGAESTLANRYVVGAKYIRRYVGRVIEDALDVNSPLGDYFIMNPGFSQTGKLYPRAVRDYKGVELSAQRKFSDHYTWQVSYLWSQLNGNYEGAYQGIGGADGTGQLDPNINSAFDEPDFIVNSAGPLSGDRRHQVKANGYYEFDNGLGLGLFFQYLSGTPVTRLGYADQVLPYGYSRYELFLTPRGDEGRTPDSTRLDFNLSYQMKLAAKYPVRFMLNVTNLLDSQTASTLDQRYNFSGLDVGQTNARFKTPNAFQSPRSIRLGVRFSF